MRISIYLCLLGPPLLALLGHRLRCYLHPAAATKAMTVVAVAGAAATGWGLVLLAAAGLGRTGEAVLLFGTDPAAVDAVDPVPRWVGLAALVLVLVAAARVARVVCVRRTVNRSLAAVGDAAADGDLVVFTTAEPHAYAIPGPRGRLGRVAVSTGLLHALGPVERRAVLAHERSHLFHRHHHYQALAAAAAAVNPLLTRLHTEIGYQIERWADEDAAARTGRGTTARSLARAALARLDTAAPATGLAFSRRAVIDRVRALQEGPAPARPAAALPAAVLTMLLLATLGDATLAFCRILTELL